MEKIMRSIIMSSSYTIINGASIVMIDGRVISGGGSCAEPKEIDKTKKIRADDITQIIMPMLQLVSVIEMM